nr:hypothetical protein [Psychrobacter ciconiae]
MLSCFSLNLDHRRLASLTILLSSMAASALLSGCSDNKSAQDNTATNTAVNTKANDLAVFSGCYTVSHDEPAQIKISEQNGAWVMQMKEPKSANRVWDNPEPLEALDKANLKTYFSIDPDNVDAVIARPDKQLVMAHVLPAYANIDPLLDSEYLAFIYKGANTIYKVDCDDVNVDILANPHANIVIDNVNDSNNSGSKSLK